MPDGGAETKSVVIRQKMKSAFAKVMLAARARGTAKEKAQQALAAFSEFGWADGVDRQALVRPAVLPVLPRQPETDQGALVALALQRLSPACIRAAVTGVQQTVTVPDAETAEAFRAALAITVKDRQSDALVKIVIAAH